MRVSAQVHFHSSLLRALLVWGPPAALALVAAAMVVAAQSAAGPLVAAFLWVLVAHRIAPRGATTWADDAPTAELEVSPKQRDLIVHEGTRGYRVRGASIATGHVVPVGLKAARLVLLGRWGRDVDAWLPSIEDARAILSELGLGPLDRPVTFSFFIGLRVTVGVDGVLVAWPMLGKRRFVPHSRIEDVRWSADHVVLVLTNGHRYEIGTRGGDDHGALVERLLAARDAYRKSQGGEPLAALARGGRSASAWVKELRAMAEAAGTQYRTASIPSETLWRIALDPAEKEELRIGAGLALRAGLDDDGKQKLRIAADASASPRVRIAFAAAADEPDDDAIAEQIEARKK